MKIRAFIFLLILFDVLSTSAQNYSITGQLSSDYMHESSLYQGEHFPSFHPQLYGDVFSCKIQEADSLTMRFEKYYMPLITAGKKLKFMARIEPQFEFAADLHSKVLFNSSTSVGLSGIVSWKNVFLQGSFNVGSYHPFEPVRYYADSLNILPGMGMISGEQSASYFFVLPELRLNFRVSNMFSAETGFATHSFGDGYRSLILSDGQYPYPYLKFRTNIWKLQYVNLFAWLNDIYTPNALSSADGISKFSATHYLSWNLNKRLSLSVFETVIIPLHDTLMKRQFVEYNYLLPIVMYRPVDFALGSPDNVLIGLNLSYRVGQKHVFYGQLMLDEMFMNEIRADLLHFVLPSDTTRIHGAWVNKQAFQLGWKYFDMFGVENFDGLVEANFIRPYTFAHRDVQQNYTHMNQSLAHPLGANLMEFLMRIRYTNEKWFAEIRTGIIRQGVDSTGFLAGNDLFQPTFDSQITGLGNIPVNYYGNSIGQGTTLDIFTFKARVSRQILPKYNITGEVGLIFQSKKILHQTHQTVYFHSGIRWGIGKERVSE